MKIISILVVVLVLSGRTAAIPAAAVLTAGAIPAGVIGAAHVSNSSVKPSEVISKYTDDQIKSCEESLTMYETQRIQENAMTGLSFMPLMGYRVYQKKTLE